MPPAYQIMAVVFLDVLGTREMSSFQEKYSIHQLFHEEVRLNEARQQQSPHVIYSRKLYSFSDCAYIFYHYKTGIEESRKNDLSLLYICLYNTSISILKILSAGFLVRGGAALGECFFDELGFFGPAVEAAYLQESKYAVYPRLLIETKIGDRLFEWERSHPIDPVVTSMFTSIPRLILEDEDGRHYLNVFYELEKSAVLISGAHHLTLEAVRNVVLNKIACDTARYASNDLIAKKLLWMRSSVERAHFRLNENYVRGSATIVLGS